MGLQAALVAGLALSAAVAYVATPVAIRVAHRFEFFDKPGGYKGHGEVTPYLGGTAVMVAFVLASLPFAGSLEKTVPVVAGAAVMWGVGTLDDRRTVAWWARILVEVALATGVFLLGLGWSLGLGGGVDLVVTVLWLVAVINALNLFDNMDGQASTMAFVIAAALAALGVVEGDRWLAVGGAALAGACLGFLPHNLARPSRIFLGDGGSMPLGFALGTLVMAGAADAAREWQALAMGILLVGVPALDTALVTISRRRRGISILAGGRDHLTHRTRRRLRTAQAVALALGSAQALLAVLAVAAARGSGLFLVAGVAVFLVVSGVLIAVLDEPGRQADERDQPLVPTRRPPHEDRGPRHVGRVPVVALALVPLGLAYGISPLASGYYPSSVWAPGGLALIVLLVAACIVRPPRLGVAAALALLAMTALAGWSLLSATWADSVADALVAGERYAVYAVILALGFTLVRDRAEAAWLLAGTAAGLWLVGLIIWGDLLTGGGADRFLNARLDQPLGYINAQGTALALGLWPALALAERRNAIAAGLGAAMASVLAGLTVLTVSRGVAFAVIASLVVVLVAVPGRLRRAYLLATLAAAVAVTGPMAFDVYERGIAAGGAVSDAQLQELGRVLLLVAGGVGALWAVATAVVQRAGAARLRRPALVLVTVMAASTGVAAAVSADRVLDRVGREYNAFVSLSVAAGGEPTGSRLFSGAGNRYDYWRIAVDAWKTAPVRGIGAGGYPRPYFVQRQTTEDIRQPHSLPLQVLTETGLIGAAVLAVLLAVLGFGVVRAGRSARRGGTDRTLAVAAAGIVVVWLAHTSVDWIHLLPGLTAVALVAAVVMLRVEPSGRGRTFAPSPLVAVPAAVVLVVSALLLGRQVVVEEVTERARAALPANPGRALDQAERALRLDPEAVPAHYLRAAALARFGQAVPARDALLEALRREPGNFVTYALLGDLAVRRGEPDEARRWYREALERNPLDPSLRRMARDPRPPGT